MILTGFDPAVKLIKHDTMVYHRAMGKDDIIFRQQIWLARSHVRQHSVLCTWGLEQKIIETVRRLYKRQHRDFAKDLMNVDLNKQYGRSLARFTVPSSMIVRIINSLIEQGLKVTVVAEDENLYIAK